MYGYDTIQKATSEQDQPYSRVCGAAKVMTFDTGIRPCD